MSENTGRVVSRFAAMQAVATSIRFGRRAGMATLAAFDAEVEAPTTIYPDAGTVVHLSAEASAILADSMLAVLDFDIDAGEDVESIVHWQMDDPRDGGGEPAEVDMSEVTQGNTEQVYRDQPIPEREA